MLADVFHTFFGWPDGGVWGNEVAAILWVPVAVAAGWLVKRAVGRLHARFDSLHESHAELHSKLDELHTKQDRLHEHLGVEPK